MSDVRSAKFDEPRPFGNVGKGQFAGKFKDRNEACGFYFAGKCRGATPKLIAEAVGINYRTATKLLNNDLSHYANIKIEFKERGEKEFERLYYTEEIAERLARAAAARRAAGGGAA